MTYRMNRAKWILSGLAALLLTLVAGLLILVNAGQSMANNQNLDAGEFGAATFTPPPAVTAREGYAAAVQAAQAWSEDAQLQRAQATWPLESDLHAPPPSWTYTFYSARREATALVNASRDGVKLLRTRAVSQGPTLVAAEAWQIDSPAAFELLYESGGEAFLTIHPQRTMMLTLHVDEPVRWQANLIDEGAIGNQAGRQIFSLTFSAQDGQLIRSPLEGDTNEEE